MNRADPADYGLDVVPSDERADTVERLVSVRKHVPRCAAYTAAGRQCVAAGTPTLLRRDGGEKIAEPLCGQHRAMIGLA